MRRMILSIVALGVIVALAACGSNEEDEATEQNQLGDTIEITEEEKMTDEEVVVLVNGSEVLGHKYNVIYPQIKMYASQMEEDVELDVIKERTIDALIDQELIYQGAEKEGIVVTEEEAEEKFAELKTENEDGLNSLLEQFHMSEDGFKDQLMFEETMEQYIDLMIDVEVEEEDIKVAYDELKAANDQIPEYEDVKEQIKAQLIKEKTDQELEAIVLDMKEEAEIEEKI